MRVAALIVRVIGWLLVGLAAAFTVTGYYGVWLNGGFVAVRDLLSPFNIVNWLVTFVVFAPGVLALGLSEKLSAKINEP